MSGLKVSHKTLSLSEKFDLISKFEKGVKRVALEQEYGIGQSSVYRTIKNKENIKAQFLEGEGGTFTKRKRTCEHPMLEDCLIKWLKSVMDRNIPVDGPLLKKILPRVTVGWKGLRNVTTWSSRKLPESANQLIPLCVMTGKRCYRPC